MPARLTTEQKSRLIEKFNSESVKNHRWRSYSGRKKKTHTMALARKSMPGLILDGN
jgi:hypothetical protein